MIPREPDISSVTFGNAIIITYKIELPSIGAKIFLKLMDDDECTIPYIIDTFFNSPEGNQLTTQAKENVWIVAINREDTITTKGVLDKRQHYHTQREITK